MAQVLTRSTCPVPLQDLGRDPAAVGDLKAVLPRPGSYGRLALASAARGALPTLAAHSVPGVDVQRERPQQLVAVLVGQVDLV